ETQTEAFKMTGRSVGDQLDQIGASTPDLADQGRPAILGPGVIAAQRLQQALQMCLPASNLEVEIALPVARLSAACRHNSQTRNRRPSPREPEASAHLPSSSCPLPADIGTVRVGRNRTSAAGTNASRRGTSSKGIQPDVRSCASNQRLRPSPPP